MQPSNAGGQRERLSLRVAGKRAIAREIVALDLISADGNPLPRFEPGAHIELLLPTGHTRSYSLYGANDQDDAYRIAVLRAPDGRGGSAAVHDTLLVGDVISVGAPRNRFALVPAPESLLFAGGIGITPLLSMAWSLWRDERPFHLHYRARSPDHMAFRDELLRVPFVDSVTLYFSDRGPSFDLATIFASARSNAHTFTCGPAGFIDSVEAAALGAGLAASQLHHERFAGAEPATGDGFHLQLVRSGIRIAVEEQESMLDAIRRAGVDVPYSCEQGVCGACITTVLDGLPDHRDAVLTDKERESGRLITPCCSRSKSPVLTLDL